MSPEDKAAHALTLGWRIVSTVPLNPADVTYEHVAPFFSGDRAALAAIARASVSATQAAAPTADSLSEPLRRDVHTSHFNSTSKQEAETRARVSA